MNTVIYIGAAIQAAAAASSDPYIRIGWRDGVSAIGILLAIAGVVIAYYQYRRAENARDAENKVRQTLFRQRASQYFSDMSASAGQLAGAIRAKDWQRTSELGTRLGGALANATGFCGTLVEDEKENLELVAGGIRFILQSTPLGDETTEAGMVREMMNQCIAVVYGVQRVAGKLMYLDGVEATNE